MKTAPINADQSKCDVMNFGTALNVQLWLTGKKTDIPMTLEKVGAQKGENCKISRRSQFVHKILTIKFKADQLDRIAGDCDGYRTIPSPPNHNLQSGFYLLVFIINFTT